MDPKNIQDLLNGLKKQTSTPDEVENLRVKYLSGRTPPNRLSIGGAMADVYNLLPSLTNYDESGLLLLNQLSKGLSDWLHQLGHRPNIYTHQEHRLFGSSSSGASDDGPDFPYTVAGCLNGKLTVEEARVARALESPTQALASHWGHDGFGYMSLPPIDDMGITIHDPKCVDSEGRVLVDRLVDGAPYKRWHTF
jgi:hypothetical protein